jgi:hypothetical protein
MGRGIALLFCDRDTRCGWVVSSTPRPHVTSGKDLVSILQEAGWAPGPVGTGRKSRPHWDLILDRPARSSVAILTELHGPYMYMDVLNYGCGFISCTVGVLVSGCIHRHANCKLEYIRLIFIGMLIYQTMVECILILRWSSIHGCLVWI